MKIPISNDILQDAVNFSDDSERLINFFKQKGLTKIRSVMAYAYVLGVSPLAAKIAVHESKSWSEAKSIDDVLHNSIAKSIKN